MRGQCRYLYIYLLRISFLENFFQNHNFWNQKEIAMALIAKSFIVFVNFIKEVTRLHLQRGRKSLTRRAIIAAHSSHSASRTRTIIQLIDRK
jgi:hypothetical protein